MNSTTTYRWRHERLACGWEPMQMIGRMKILAARDGVTLPQVWLLLKLVFLWENQRLPVPIEYAGLLARVFDTYVSPGRHS